MDVFNSRKNIRIMLALAIFLVAWMMMAPFIFTFSSRDEKARDEFRKLGLDLRFFDEKVNGSNIHYVVTGNDTLPTLVFIHGSPSTWTAFAHFMKDPDLRSKYRMASIDRPGFGGSDPGEARHLQDQSQLIIPVLRKLVNGKPMILAGHSLGGPLVVQLAADDPKDIHGIILLAGSVAPALEPKEYWRYVMNVFPLRYLLPGAFRPSNTELVYFKDDVKKLEQDFAKVTCEVYILHGDKDTWVPPGNVDFAKEKLVHAKSVFTQILAGANHFIPWTRTADIKRTLLRAGSFPHLTTLAP
jgi:pimeloyl-ACP methyl ester carboxylesterase